jgi:hypothetical protein
MKLGLGCSEYSEVERGAVEEDMLSAFRIAFWLDAAGHGGGRTTGGGVQPRLRCGRVIAQLRLKHPDTTFQQTTLQESLSGYSMCFARHRLSLRKLLGS